MLEGLSSYPYGRFLRPVLPVAAIVALGTLVYANTFGVPLVYDDRDSILQNRVIRDWSDLGALWRFNPTRFVLYFSLALNYRLGGLEVWGYHLMNLAIHLGAALLVYWLVRLIHFSSWARSQPRETVRHGPEVALFSALLFVAHPIQTQAVTYIVQRAESLAAFFYLLALALYVRGRQSAADGLAPALPCHGEMTSCGRPRGSSPAAAPWLLAALLSAALGMLTKETVASLSAALLLYEVCFLSPLSRPSRLLWLLPFCLLPVFPFWLSTGGELALPSQGGALSRWSYLVTQSRVLVTYMRLLLLPIGQNLDYDYPAYDSLRAPAVLGSLLLLASLLVLAVLAFKRHRLLFFALLWFFVTLSVTSSVIPVLDVIYEHRLYLATLGYGLFLSWVLLRALENWGKWSRGIALAALSFLVLAYALAAHQRNRVWGDEVGLWQDCVAKSPRKARPHKNLGSALIEAGRYPEATSPLRIAIALKPDDAEAYYNLGLAYQSLQLFDPAIEAYRRAVALRPGDGHARNNLGIAYINKGWYGKAMEEFEKALRLDKENAAAASNLERLRKERRQKAMEGAVR